MEFETNLDGHALIMDAAAADGGEDKGLRPKGLLLAGLSGCTGMDVVSILRKMREPCTWFEIRVEAVTSDEHPKRYTEIKLTYQFRKSDKLNPENVKKACILSQDKYCGVSAMLKDASRVSWDVEYL